MFRLFHFLFDRAPGDASPYPEHLVELAIEHAVDGTDPRLRTLPGYQRRLRPAVLKAVDQVVALVQELPPFAPLNPSDYGANPELSALFASAEHVREMLRDDTSLAELVAAPESSGADSLYGLLAAELRERRVLGMELQGDILQREVVQTSVSFSGQRLVDPALTEEVLRKRLRRRAFDHLLALALQHIGENRESRADLQRQRDLLQRRLRTLESGQWGFQGPQAGPPPTLDRLEADLARIETELHEVGSGAEVLESNLEEVVEVLGDAPKQLYANSRHLILDRMGIVREHPEGNSLDIRLMELHSANGRSLVVLPVTISRRELPAPKDLIAEALRYLG